MTRLANRRDANHAAIAAAFKRMGWAVGDTSRVGDDWPDLVIAKHTAAGRITALVEVKREKGKLSTGQSQFAAQWPGKLYVCRTVDDVLRVNDDNQRAEAP